MSNQNQLVWTVQRVGVTRRQDCATVPQSLMEFAQAAVAPLAVRPPRNLEPTISYASIPPVEISLYEGTVRVNERVVRIPVGMTGRMTGRAFKRFASVYRGDGLFIRLEDGSLRRIGDHETIQVTDGAAFTHVKGGAKV